MTIESRTAAAQAVLRSAAMPAEPDEFWTLVAVGNNTEPFPPEVEQHRADVAGVAFYPKGILAQHALGRTVQVVNVEFDDEPCVGADCPEAVTA